MSKSSRSTTGLSSRALNPDNWPLWLRLVLPGGISLVLYYSILSTLLYRISITGVDSFPAVAQDWYAILGSFGLTFLMFTAFYGIVRTYRGSFRRETGP